MKTKSMTLLIALLLISWIGTAQIGESIPLPPAVKTGGMPLMDALQKRQSDRTFSSRDLSLQQLSDLLWAASGINRPDGKRTAPSARAWNEIDILVVKADGWYWYKPETHSLLKMGNEDLRSSAGTQDFVKDAPLNLIYVADYGRMTNAPEEDKAFYSAADTGFISQNVYLFCASSGLATVVRGLIDKPGAKKIFRLKPEQHVVLAQTVGFPGN